MTGADDGSLDALRQQFGITTTTGPSTTTMLPGPSLAGTASSGSNGGTVPSAGGNGASMDDLRRQFGITTAPPAAPSSPSGPRPAPQQAAAAGVAPAAPKQGFLGRVVSDAKAGVGGLVHLPAAAVHDVETFAGAATGQKWGNAGIVRQPGESLSEFTARKYPLLGGALVQGPVNLFEHAAHPTQAAKDYSAHPLLGPLGDVATLAMFAGPALKAASAAGEGAAEGSTLARVAKGATVAHDTLENAANPLRPILNGAGPVPGLRAIPEHAFQAVQNGSTDALTRVAAKLARPMHDTSAAILEGQANEAAAKGTQARLGKLLTGILPDRDEQAAALGPIGERTAPALAALRAHLGPDAFAHYVEGRYQGTLTVKAANLAADVAEGKAPELAAKVQQFLSAYHDAVGGQGERTAAFLAKPGHEYQAGYEPNPVAVKDAVDEASKGLPRLAKLADQARARADQAKANVAPGEARVDAGKVDVRAQRLSDAIDRVAKAKTTLERAQQRAAAGEDRVADAADRSVPTVEQAQKVYQREVAKVGNLRSLYVNEAKAQAEQARGDLGQFFTQGPLGRFADQAAQADWYRNLPSRIRQALHGGAGLTEPARRGDLASLGMGPDEFIDAARHANPAIADLTEDQIAQRFAQLYDRYAELRKAPFLSGENLTAGHLRAAGIEDPELEALIGAPAGVQSRELAAQRGIMPPDPADLEQRRLGALTGALGAVDETRVAAARAAETPSAEARRVLVADVADRHGKQAGLLAGRAYDQAVAEQRVPTLAGKVAPARGRLVAPLVEAGRQAGKGEMRARVLGNLADQAEARVGKIQTAADRARVNAEQSIENAPARLKPALAENRAAAHTLVGVVNDLRARGLDEAARQAEDAIGNLPRNLGDLKAQGVDAEHFFHTQEGQPGKGSMARQSSLPRTFTAGSEKLRTGSPVYDRTVAGQLKGGEEAMRSATRQATADKIASMPFAARLGQGALEGAHNTTDALAKGYVPWSPSTIFDRAGRVRPLDQLDEALSIEHPQVFLPKPVFDEFRNYFEPRRGQVLGAFLDPVNRIRFMANLALKPGYIVARVFGHALLGLAGTSDPAGLAGNLLEAYRQWKGSADDVSQRYFPQMPPRLLHGQADSAEYARMVSDTAPGQGRLAGLADKVPGKSLTDLGTKAVRRPMQFASFMDNVQRTAFYLTERSKVGETQALESSLRALGEFDRATPFERDYIRRVVPFWQWHKELTRIAFHLPEDHPLRVAWTLHLGSLASQPDNSVSDPWNQALHLGPYSIDAGSLSPFNQVPNTFGGGAFGVGKIAGTVPQIAYGAVTGEKASTGRPFTGPPGSAQTVRPTAPSLMHLFAQTLPQVRVLNALTGRDKYQRYDTGDLKIPAYNHYQPLPNQYGTGLGQLTQFLGLPVQRTAELQADEARYNTAKTKAQTQSAKSQQRYKGRLGRLAP